MPTNLLSVNAAGIETSIAGWSAGTHATACIQDNAHAHSGTYAMKLTSDTSASPTNIQAFPASPYAAPVNPGDTCHFEYWVYTTAAGRTAAPAWDWYNGTSWISLASGSAQALTQNAWTLVSAEATAPASTTLARPYPGWVGASAAESMWIDDLSFYILPSPYPTIPTAASGDLLSSTTTVASTTHTFPSLSSLRGGAGPQAGDLLIAICVQYQGGTSGNEFGTWGASFTETADLATITALDEAVGVAHKIATGSETGTFTVTSAHSFISAQFLMRIPAGTWHGTTIPEVSTAVRATGAVADAPSLDPANWATEATLWITVYGHSETTTSGSPPAITTAPTNYSGALIAGRGTDAVGAVTGAVAFRQSTASSEDAGVWTVTNATRGNGIALTIAVRPAATVTDATVDMSGKTVAATASVPVPVESGTVIAAAVAAAATAPAPAGQNAQVRPAAVAAVTAIPSPVVPNNYKAAAVVAATTTIPVPVVSGSVNAAAAAATTAIPNPVKQGSVNAAAVAATTAVPAPAGQNAQVRPTVVAAVAAVPTPLVVPAPPAVAAVVVIPAPTGQQGQVRPVAAAATTTIPPPVTQGSAVAAAVAGAVSIPVPAGQNAQVRPAAVAAVTSIPVPVVQGPVTVTAVAPPAVAIPVPAGLSATVRPAAVAVTTAIPVPVASGGIVAAAVAATTAVPVPAGENAQVRPAAVAATAAVPSAIASGSDVAASVAATTSIPVPTGLSAQVRPAAVVASAAVPALSSAQAYPAAVAAMTAIPVPVISGSITATAVVATTAVPNPVKQGSVLAAAVTATTAVPAPAGENAQVSPAAVASTVTVPVPAILTGSAAADDDPGTGSDEEAALAASLSDDDAGSAAEDGNWSVSGAAISDEDDSGISAADEEVSLALSAADAASGAEDLAGLDLADADTGSGADDLASLALADTDDGSGAENSTQFKTDGDTVSFTEASREAPEDTDAGHGLDTGSFAAALSGTDTGTGADTQVSIALHSSDTGHAADYGTPAGGPQFAVDDDTYHGEESQIFSLSTPDTGTGAENAMVALASGDAATGSESSQIAISGTIWVSASDSGGSAEAALIAQDVPYGTEADNGSGTEDALISQADDDLATGGDDGTFEELILIYDDGAGLSALDEESVVMGTRTFGDDDAGSAADGGESLAYSGTLYVFGNDAAASAEAGCWSGDLASADMAASAEASVIVTAISDSDACSGAEAIPGGKIEVWSLIPPSLWIRLGHGDPLGIQLGDAIVIIGEGPDAYVSAPRLDVHALRMVQVLMDAPLGAVQLNDSDSSLTTEDWVPPCDVTAAAFRVPVLAEAEVR